MLKRVWDFIIGRNQKEEIDPDILNEIREMEKERQYEQQRKRSANPAG